MQSILCSLRSIGYPEVHLHIISYIRYSHFAVDSDNATESTRRDGRSNVLQHAHPPPIQIVGCPCADIYLWRITCTADQNGKQLQCSLISSIDSTSVIYVSIVCAEAFLYVTVFLAAALFLLRFQQVVASDVVLEFFVNLFGSQPEVLGLVVVQDT